MRARLREPCGFEIGDRAAGEEAAEGGEAEARLAAGEGAEGDEQALPAVVVVVPGGAADGAAAELGEGVAVGVESAAAGASGAWRRSRSSATMRKIRR